MAKAKTKQTKKFYTETYDETTRDTLLKKAQEEINRLDDLKNKLNDTIDDYLYDDNKSPAGLIKDMIKCWEHDIDEKDVAIRTLDDLETMVEEYVYENNLDKQQAMYEILKAGVDTLFENGFMVHFREKDTILSSFLEKMKKLSSHKPEKD